MAGRLRAGELFRDLLDHGKHLIESTAQALHSEDEASLAEGGEVGRARFCEILLCEVDGGALRGTERGRIGGHSISPVRDARLSLLGSQPERIM